MSKFDTRISRRDTGISKFDTRISRRDQIFAKIGRVQAKNHRTSRIIGKNESQSVGLHRSVEIRFPNNYSRPERAKYHSPGQAVLRAALGYGRALKIISRPVRAREK
jgi:hypothetical protein